METSSQLNLQLPADLIAEVEARAASEHCPARELLREAVERYVQDRQPYAGVNKPDGLATGRTAQDAAARMLARRHLHPLPDGVTVRELMTFGRA